MTHELQITEYMDKLTVMEEELKKVSIFSVALNLCSGTEITMVHTQCLCIVKAAQLWIHI